MTDEEGFQAALDRVWAGSEADATRLALADWLREQGDPRADGYAALGAFRRAPERFFRTYPVSEPRWEDVTDWSWYRLNPQVEQEQYLTANSALPAQWSNKIGWNHLQKTRREADEIAVKAFLDMSATERAGALAVLGTVFPEALVVLG